MSLRPLKAPPAARIAEGNVGGGAGMIVHGWKGGTGTASRVIDPALGGYTVGVLVQANYGDRLHLRIAGAPVGAEIVEPAMRTGGEPTPPPARGSIIVIVGTDAPLIPHQLKRVAKRPTLALGRMGSVGGESSGDIFMAFSTASPTVAKRLAEPLRGDDTALLSVAALPINGILSAVFAATVEATEEAITNALIAAEDMHGINDNFVPALPHDKLREALKKYNRLSEA